MESICQLSLYQKVTIDHLTHPDPLMERRLLDLGFSPGTEIEKTLISPKGDPMAYRVRGTTIALRNEDAQHIFYKREED